MDIKRCNWTKDNSVNNEYHDNEWGVPVHDDLKLFEFLVLDSFQAGLSWLTILEKRENFAKAFDYFDPYKISKYNSGKIEELMNDNGIVRNKLKILATINNARAFIDIQKQYGSFEKYIWQFTGHKTIQNYWSDSKQVPSKTKESDAMSNDLKKKAFKFLGSTICYAFMQGAGMVNDHLTTCFRHSVILNLSENKSLK